MFHFGRAGKRRRQPPSGTRAIAFDFSCLGRVETIMLFPDAVQRAALAERCAADPGSFHIMSSPKPG